ncbi:hypothetical protein NUH30_19515 [Leptospira sp. 85282-16]|uniref:hypothetical protein n=1 Tax=Leptospira sp. 85282-16 TaxID=2971256 RepID=UPI0021BEE537|nr:hypothetical protein [Leptospira sp. 85282-16]MCT8335885.1 hypothetical protein [Leptospira sp. 85282-16]
MYETAISFIHTHLGNLKVNFQQTVLTNKWDSNLLTFAMQIEITNPLPIVSYGYELVLKVNGNQEITKKHFLISFDFSSKHTYNFLSNFNLSNSVLEYIEKNRTNDLILGLDFTFFVYKKIKIKDINNQEIEAIGPTHNSIFGYLNFPIPKSFWIEHLLINSTLEKIALVEIPIGSITNTNFFLEAINELKEAKKYYSQGDYDKSVAHCRSMQEAMMKEKNILTKYSDSNSNKKAFLDANKLTLDWLEKSGNAIKAITNKPHHPPSMGHFGREESYSIMLISMAILKFWTAQLKEFDEIAENLDSV